MAIGRFMSIDPLAEEYAYNSTYAFAENKLGMGRELEGCELGPLFGVAEFVKISAEIGAKTSEVVGKTSEVAGKATEGTGRFSKTQLESFARGNAAEAEQLAKNGLEKNTKPYEATDPKTGKTGKTIPDSFEKTGNKETVEVKNVKYQGETSQLRMQRAISNARGGIPRLIINEGAKLSRNLTNGNYKIDTYNVATPTVIESTGVRKPELPKPAPKPAPDPNMI